MPATPFVSQDARSAGPARARGKRRLRLNPLLSKRASPAKVRGYVPSTGRAGSARTIGRRSFHGHKFVSWLNRNRRLVVALLLCVAAGIAVHQLTPDSGGRLTVLSAARDLPAGANLADSDFASLHVLPDGAPEGALTAGAQLRGRQLASPLKKGQIPTDAQLVGPGLLTGTAPEIAAVPVRMADPASIQLVSPGQLVNIVLTAGDGPARKSELLATAVPVLWTSAQGGKANQWLGTNDADGLVVVAANPQQAEALAGASTRGKLFFVLVSPAANPPLESSSR